MNYRHAYHAGNFGDVLKHVVLTRILDYLKRKDKAFRIIDTHAGIGRYDLASIEAGKTGEWEAGIGRLYSARIPSVQSALLTPYLQVLSELNPSGDLSIYPGSPLLARHLFRKQDRLTATELHPDDFKTLSALFDGDYQARIVHLDGWNAFKSFVPVKEKRGLVLVDPAFEERDDFSKLSNGLMTAYKKWASGIYCLWYPIKDKQQVRLFKQSLAASGIANIMCVELCAKALQGREVFAGSGLAIVNPPWILEEELSVLLPYLTDVMAQDEMASWSIDRVAGE